MKYHNIIIVMQAAERRIRMLNREKYTEDSIKEMVKKIAGKGVRFTDQKTVSNDLSKLIGEEGFTQNLDNNDPEFFRGQTSKQKVDSGGFFNTYVGYNMEFITNDGLVFKLLMGTLQDQDLINIINVKCGTVAISCGTFSEA